MVRWSISRVAVTIWAAWVCHSQWDSLIFHSRPHCQFCHNKNHSTIRRQVTMLVRRHSIIIYRHSIHRWTTRKRTWIHNFYRWEWIFHFVCYHLKALHLILILFFCSTLYLYACIIIFVHNVSRENRIIIHHPIPLLTPMRMFKWVFDRDRRYGCSCLPLTIAQEKNSTFPLAPLIFILFFFPNNVLLNFYVVIMRFFALVFYCLLWLLKSSSDQLNHDHQHTQLWEEMIR